MDWLQAAMRRFHGSASGLSFPAGPSLRLSTCCPFGLGSPFPPKVFPSATAPQITLLDLSGTSATAFRGQVHSQTFVVYRLRGWNSDQGWSGLPDKQTHRRCRSYSERTLLSERAAPLVQFPRAVYLYGAGGRVGGTSQVELYTFTLCKIFLPKVT